MELGNMFFGNSRGEFKVNRDWQDEFVEFLNAAGFDSYGGINSESLTESLFKNEMLYFENDTFTVMRYYWGEDEEISELPNFIYKPLGFKLNWYKYPLRDSYMNQDISFDEFKSILSNCLNSLVNTL